VEGEGSDRSYDHPLTNSWPPIDEAHTAPSTFPFGVQGNGVANAISKIRLASSFPPKRLPMPALARGGPVRPRPPTRRVRLFVDAEESWFQHTIDQLAYDIRAKYNRERPLSGIILPALHRHDRLMPRKAAHDAAEAGYYIGVKLVRGAYMEKKKVAKQRGQSTPPTPPSRPPTTHDESLLALLHGARDRISICAGTHNEASSPAPHAVYAAGRPAPWRSRVVYAALRHERQPHLQLLANAGYNTAALRPTVLYAVMLVPCCAGPTKNTAIAGYKAAANFYWFKELPGARLLVQYIDKSLKGRFTSGRL
jgi:proline dehydrogenase